MIEKKLKYQVKEEGRGSVRQLTSVGDVGDIFWHDSGVNTNIKTVAWRCIACWVEGRRLTQCSKAKYEYGGGVIND